MVKSLTHPTTGKVVKFGRYRPVANPPFLKFQRYISKDKVTGTLPTPPDSINYIGPALSAAGLENILGNDVLGDCTAAGACHIEDTWRANAGNGLPMISKADAIKFYSATTGYVPGEPSTDQGGDEVTVLNYWRKFGLFGNGSAKLTAYLSVDATNVNELKSAIWFAENLYFGVELPDAWINPFPSANGFVWDVAGNPDPNNGHCFVGLGYNSTGVIIDTWGLIGVITWAAVAKYASLAEAGQVFTVFGKDMLNWKTGKVPSGFDYGQLVADMNTLV